MSNVFDLIKRVGEKEAAVQEFVSPIFFNEYVVTKIEGIVYKFKISQKNPGWYKIRSIDRKSAKTIEQADLSEIDSYLKFLAKIRIILIMKKNNIYYGIPEKLNNLGFAFEEMIPIYLTDDSVQDFDRIIGRFDGANFWYHQIDYSNDISKATYLREQLLKVKEPKKICYSGLTIEEKLAYALRVTLDKKLIIDKKKATLKDDVEHAGGEFVKFTEKSDHFSVTYIVDGHQYTSHVSKNESHSVITAGICLSGEDRKYDLKSLITVMREGQHAGRIYRTHNL
jgi:hypothetical protein